MKRKALVDMQVIRVGAQLIRDYITMLFIIDQELGPPPP